jgi:hypothetical protein
MRAGAYTRLTPAEEAPTEVRLLGPPGLADGGLPVAVGLHASGPALGPRAMAGVCWLPMGLFTTREAAEEFVKEDPFVVNGVVGRWRIREWADVFSS